MTSSSSHGQCPEGVLAGRLLGIDSEQALDRSPFLGAVFEGFVAAEIVKHQVNAGRGKALYYFRDRQGLEVDFLLDFGGRRVALIEAKAMRGYDVRRFVIHRPTRSQLDMTALSPGVKALSVDRLKALWTA